MDNVKNDTYHIDKIRDDLQFIIAHMKGVDLSVVYDTLINDIPELLESIS